MGIKTLLQQFVIKIQLKDGFKIMPLVSIKTVRMGGILEITFIAPKLKLRIQILVLIQFSLNDIFKILLILQIIKWEVPSYVNKSVKDCYCRRNVYAPHLDFFPML